MPSTALNARFLCNLRSQTFPYLIASEQAESIQKINNDVTVLGILGPSCACFLGLSGGCSLEQNNDGMPFTAKYWL